MPQKTTEKIAETKPIWHSGRKNTEFTLMLMGVCLIGLGTLWMNSGWPIPAMGLSSVLLGFVLHAIAFIRAAKTGFSGGPGNVMWGIGFAFATCGICLLVVTVVLAGFEVISMSLAGTLFIVGVALLGIAFVLCISRLPLLKKMYSWSCQVRWQMTLSKHEFTEKNAAWQKRDNMADPTEWSPKNQELLLTLADGVGPDSGLTLNWLIPGITTVAALANTGAAKNITEAGLNGRILLATLIYLVLVAAIAILTEANNAYGRWLVDKALILKSPPTKDI